MITSIPVHLPSSFSVPNHNISSTRFPPTSSHKATMDATRGVDGRSNPFLQLQQVKGGHQIIKLIVAYAAETVDAFTTRLPVDRRLSRFVTKVGPPWQWLRGHGYLFSSNGLVWRSHDGQFQIAPTWYLVRLETKMRIVCQQWKDIADNEIVSQVTNRSHQDLTFLGSNGSSHICLAGSGWDVVVRSALLSDRVWAGSRQRQASLDHASRLQRAD